MEGLNQGEALPYIKKTKKRPSVTKRAKFVALTCFAITISLVFGGLYLQQQESLRENAEASSSYTAAAIRPAERNPLAVFVGDSYTTGSGASTPSRRWTTLTSVKMGWTEKNLGSPGAGYLSVGKGTGCPPAGCENYLSATETIIKAHPSVVVVSGGRNDSGQEKNELRDAAHKFFTDIREGLPEAKIIATSATWDARTPPAELAQVDQIIEDSVTAVDGTYLDIANFFVGKPDLIGTDGVHPTDKGYRMFFEAALPGIKAATS